MQRLSDGRDLISLGQVGPNLHVLSEDRLLWKRLCLYHFSERQVSGAPQTPLPSPSSFVPTLKLSWHLLKLEVWVPTLQGFLV